MILRVQLDFGFEETESILRFTNVVLSMERRRISKSPRGSLSGKIATCQSQDCGLLRTKDSDEFKRRKPSIRSSF